MKLKLIARRYGEAFWFYALETIGIEKCAQEISVLSRLLKDCPELGIILQGHSITTTEKFEFIDNVLKKYFSPEVLQFLKLVVEKNRVDLLPDMIDFILTGCAYKEETPAVIKSAYPLDENTISEITQKLEQKFKKKLRVSTKIDEGLIGGVQVEIGNTTIDGSLKGRLNEVKDEIQYARMH